MSESYYHITQPLLATGSVIENGNFGRLLEKYNREFGNLEILYREEVLEFIRKEKYPAKPSRFKSIFLLDSIENAFKYKEVNAPNQNIYKVKILDSTKPTHKGFWCPNFPPSNYRQYNFEYADKYWKSEIEPINISCKDNIISVIPTEIIIESSVRILERIEH